MDFILDLAWAEELKVILRAPISFIIMMILGWGIITHLVRLLYGKQLADKDSTIGLLQQRLEYASEISSKAKDEERGPTSLASIREGLSAHITLGDSLWVEGMHHITESTLADWGQRIHGWVGTVADFLRKNLSAAEVQLFIDARTLEPKTFNSSFSAEHNGHLQILYAFIGNLRQILRDCR